MKVMKLPGWFSSLYRHGIMAGKIKPKSVFRENKSAFDKLYFILFCLADFLLTTDWGLTN